MKLEDRGPNTGENEGDSQRVVEGAPKMIVRQQAKDQNKRPWPSRKILGEF